jgi:nucleoid-associated protein YgaU
MNRYKDIQILKNPNNIRYYAENKYPEIPLTENDVWVITTIGDRYDLLAQQYYGDKSLWWIIASANNNVPKNSLYTPVGTQLRIPNDVNGVLVKYRELNSNV